MIDYAVFFLGADNDVEASKEFIKNKYLNLVPPRDRLAEKNIYPHFTCSVGESLSLNEILAFVVKLDI